MDLLSSFVETAYADTFNVTGPFNLEFMDVVLNAYNTLTVTIVPVATGIFVLGAFWYTLAGDQDDKKSQGKKWMIGSLVGMAVVISSKAIVNLAMLFLYGRG